jgi:hypothetical protein
MQSLKEIYAQKDVAHKEKCLTRIGVLYTSIGMLARKNHTLGEAARSLQARKPRTISLRSLAMHKTGVRQDMVLGFLTTNELVDS